MSDEKNRGDEREPKKRGTTAKEKKLKPEAPSAGLVKQGTTLVKRTNEFDGLTEDARVELAVTRIRGAWAVATGATISMGRTVIDACHDGDEKAALEERADDNEVFRRVVRSLGTLEGGPSAKVLSGARRVAAATRAVDGHFWDLVPYSHKEILVRLPLPEKMIEGAGYVAKFAWTLEQTEDWVNAERAKLGVKKTDRGRRLGSTRSACKGLAKVAEPESLERIGSEFAELDEEAQRKVLEELDRATSSVQKLRQRLAALVGKKSRKKRPR